MIFWCDNSITRSDLFGDKEDDFEIGKIPPFLPLVEV